LSRDFPGMLRDILDKETLDKIEQKIIKNENENGNRSEYDISCLPR